MSSEGASPRKGDRVRVVVEGDYVEYNPATGEHAVNAGMPSWVGFPAGLFEASVEVLERADDPGQDPIGTVRKGPKSSPVVRSRVMSDDTYPWKSVMYTINYSHDEVVGWPVIGAVPGTPAAESAGTSSQDTAAKKRDLCTVDDCPAGPRCSSGASVWHERTPECVPPLPVQGVSS